MKNQIMKEGGLASEAAAPIEGERIRTKRVFRFGSKVKRGHRVHLNIYGRGRANSMTNNISFEETEDSERGGDTNGLPQTQAVKVFMAPVTHLRKKVRELVSKLSVTVSCLGRRSLARNDVEGTREQTISMAYISHESPAPIPLLLFSGRQYHLKMDQSAFANVTPVTTQVGHKRRRSCHDLEDGHDMKRTAVADVMERTEADGIDDIKKVDNVEDVGDIEEVDDIFRPMKAASVTDGMKSEFCALQRLSSQWTGRFPTLRPSSECRSLDERHDLGCRETGPEFQQVFRGLSCDSAAYEDDTTKAKIWRKIKATIQGCWSLG